MSLYIDPSREFLLNNLNGVAFDLVERKKCWQSALISEVA